MSKHVGRKQRWVRQDARRYTSPLGRVVYEQNGWYALLDYRTLAPTLSEGGLPTWVHHTQRLGPFKRPRNAMIALERETTVLRNRHGENVLFGDQLWGEV
jgi:hypothetical protein